MPDLAGDPDCARRGVAQRTKVTRSGERSDGGSRQALRQVAVSVAPPVSPVFCSPTSDIAAPPRPGRAGPGGTASKRRIRCHCGNFIVTLWITGVGRKSAAHSADFPDGLRSPYRRIEDRRDTTATAADRAAFPPNDAFPVAATDGGMRCAFPPYPRGRPPRRNPLGEFIAAFIVPPIIAFKFSISSS
jgi:hypothetical protein